MSKLMAAALAACGFAGAALAQDREAISAGSAIYRDKCVDCHGAGLVPTGAGADLRDLGAGDRPIFDKAMKEGRNQMPSWDGQFTPQQLEQIWAYIRSRAND